jgi:hypothetical protein
MLNEFGYDSAAPNAPWMLRDQLQKCSCGNIYSGLPGRKCTACVAEALAESVIRLRAIVNAALPGESK